LDIFPQSEKRSSPWHLPVHHEEDRDMTDYLYKALDAQGQFVSGQLQAASPNAAVQQLIELGYVPLDTKHSTSERRWASLFLPQPSVPKREITILFQDLALLLRSGLPLDEGLRLLVDEVTGLRARLISQLRSSIASGMSFADALRAHSATNLPEVIAIVRAAEATGKLDGALDTIAQERTKYEKLSARITAALRYPIFLLLVSVAVLTFFLIFVVPQFAAVVRDFGTRQDGLVTTVIAISDGLRQNGDIIAGSLAVLLAGLLLMVRSRTIRQSLATIFGRLPVICTTIALRRTTLFCRELGTLLSSGVNLTDSLRLMNEGKVGGEQLTGVIDRVRRGGRLVDAITEANLLPPLAARMLRVGEESGALALVATRCADYYEAKLTDQIDRLTGIVGPAAIIVIATVVGVLIVSIMSTLLSIDQMVM
jgi:general secretion pathway protein F